MPRRLLLALAVLAAACTPHKVPPKEDAPDAAPPPPACPTPEKFAALKEGMTVAQVDGVMGGSGNVVSQTPEMTFINFVCFGPKRRITVTMRSGALAIKTADGI